LISVEGKVIIITGAAQGLGSSYAEFLAKNGAKLVLADISEKKLAKTAAFIQSQGGKCVGLNVDVQSKKQTEEMAKTTVEQFGRIDVLVNNAAMFAGLKKKTLMELEPEEWDQVMSVNVKGSFLCCRAVFPQMKAQKKGKIINISSGTFFNGASLLTHYVTSKGAIMGLTHALARELGEYNITINALAPGFTITDAALGIESDQKYREFVVSRRALKREQVPEDLTGTMLYLCSSASDFLTGQTIVVNGGDSFS
jgi:NAD(P)-dependent dehydrogenase (short-subunit alcohol dehydrogenase family)